MAHIAKVMFVLMAASQVVAQTSDVEFRLLLDGDSKSTASASNETHPIANAFVWVDPVNREVRDLIRNQLNSPKPKQVRFAYADGCIEPQSQTIHLRDTLWRTYSDNRTRVVSFMTISNSPQTISPIGSARTFQLRKPERFPVRVWDELDRSATAYLLVLNHQWGGVTDKRGTTTIKGLPHGVDFRFRVACPWQQKKESVLRFSSKSLDFNAKKRARFSLLLDHDTSKQHVIRVTPVAKPKEEKSVAKTPSTMD